MNDIVVLDGCGCILGVEVINGSLVFWKNKFSKQTMVWRYQIDVSRYYISNQSLGIFLNKERIIKIFYEKYTEQEIRKTIKKIENNSYSSLFRHFKHQNVITKKILKIKLLIIMVIIAVSL